MLSKIYTSLALLGFVVGAVTMQTMIWKDRSLRALVEKELQAAEATTDPLTRASKIDKAINHLENHLVYIRHVNFGHDDVDIPSLRHFRNLDFNNRLAFIKLKRELKEVATVISNDPDSLEVVKRVAHRISSNRYSVTKAM